MKVVLTDGSCIKLDDPPANPAAIPAMILTGVNEHGTPMTFSGRYAVRWWDETRTTGPNGDQVAVWERIDSTQFVEVPR